MIPPKKFAVTDMEIYLGETRKDSWMVPLGN